MGIQFDGVNNRVTTGDIVSETGTISGNLGIGGTLTYEDVTNVDSVGVITARDGLRVTGIATITGNIDMKTGGSGNLILGDDQKAFFGDNNELTIQHSSPAPGNFIEGDSAGKNLFIRSKLNQEQLKLVPDGQVEAYFAGSKKFETTGSGTITTGIITAIGGNSNEGSFLTGTSVGIGTTTTAGRNAGVGTATGEIIYNASDSLMQVWTGSNWESVKFIPPINVSGGTISDSARSGYITHTFTSPGNFVTDGSLTSSEIFVIGGGAGGGGRRYGAGGGAGGAMLSTGVTIDAGTYGVQIGSGGAGGTYPSPNAGNRGSDGGNTIFGPGGPQQRQGTGGGGGAAYNPPNFQGRPGGCGGGAASYPDKAGGSSTQPSAPGSGTDYGNRGGNYNTPGGGWAPAGGGGTNGQGVDSPGDRINGGGNGGDGVQLSISGTATYYGGGGGGGSFDYVSLPGPGSWPGPYPSPNSMKCRGGNGGGGCGNNQPNSAPTQTGPGINPFAAGTNGSSPNQHGLANTGSGGAGMAGAGGYNFSPTGAGGNGGSGLVIVAYPKTQAAGEVRF